MNARQSEMKVFSGSAHPDLAQRICDSMGVPLGKATISSFPDGETYVRFEENIRGRDIFLIQPTSPPTNQHLMELLIMVDAARRASADRITAVVPFFGYARQDRKDQPRVPITAKLVANLLHAAGVDRVLTMDLHAQQVQGFFDIPVDHLYSLPVLIKYLRQRLTEKTVVVSPDVGGLKMASAYANALNANLAIVAKQRKSATETEALYLIGEVEGCDVLLVDDLTETAGTLASAASMLKKHGAHNIYAGVSHAVLVDIAIPRLQNSQIEELITTNSTPVRPVENFKTTVLCISELLGEGMKRIHKDESVSSLFKIDGNPLEVNMAKQVKLTAERRAVKGRSAVRKLKARGIVPAVIYGAQVEPETLQVFKRDINALLSHASGENILVELEISDEGSQATNRLALVQEVQHSPVGGDILHVDFHAVSMDEVIEADVPLEPHGTANGVKNFGGLLEQSLRSLAIECLPRDLPDRIEVDVSNLNIGDAIHVREIRLPEGVRTRVPPDLTAFSVLAPTVEEEPVAAAETAAAGPEVIREKKEETEGSAPTPPGKEKEK